GLRRNDGIVCRNDGEMLSIVMSPTPLGSLHSKHYDNDSKIRSSQRDGSVKS
ncbi:MAG: hypothetical protein GXP23_03720, partial [Gammaproteobacteria bacterium]|nr:hypothetical protein [Gammaproteobacteria bacterium]